MSNDSKSKEKKANANEGSLLVVNLRGLVNTRTPVRTTLEQLSIARRFNATIVPNNKVYRGMLNVSKDRIAWCKLDGSLAQKLLETRSERSTGVRFEEQSMKDSEDYRSFSDFAKGLELGNARLNDVKAMRPFFRLKPPRGGFKKSTRRQFRDGGVLGHNEELPKLVERML